MSAFLDSIKAKAKADKKTIVLPESMDRRTFEAAAVVLKEDLADLIILGNPEDIAKNSEGLDVSKAQFIDPKTSDKLDGFVDLLVELRKKKGLTPEDARKLLTTDNMYFACMMVKTGMADGVVSGACHSTANTLRPALQIIKTAPGTKMVSGFFVMVVPDCEYGEKGTFVFSDCGLNQNPDAEGLAAIAASSAQSFKMLVGAEPKVAMMSYSTYGSAKDPEGHDDIARVRKAAQIAKEQNPGLLVDGEMQADAAMVPSVGASKAPGSSVAGQANVLIFPDLGAGNIGYKLVQRLAKAEAYGPMLQGIAAPVNDLSRGCSAADIVGVIAITAVQAQNK